jgi:hypothetical protein
MILSFNDNATRKEFVERVRKERDDIAIHFVLLENFPIVAVSGLDTAQASWVVTKVKHVGIAEEDVEFQQFGLNLG